MLASSFSQKSTNVRLERKVTWDKSTKAEESEDAEEESPV